MILHNKNAERAVLIGVLLDNEVLGVVKEMLIPEDFGDEATRTIFEAILAIYKKGLPIDIVTIRSELKAKLKLQAVGGDDFLLDLTHMTSSIEEVEKNARVVFQNAVLRKIVNSCYEIAKDGANIRGLMSHFEDLIEREFGARNKKRPNDKNGKTFLLIELLDARLYLTWCEITAKAQQQYLRVISRGSRLPEDITRMLELNNQLRDQMVIIDNQCNHLLETFRTKGDNGKD